MEVGRITTFVKSISRAHKIRNNQNKNPYLCYYYHRGQYHPLLDQLIWPATATSILKSTTTTLGKLISTSTTSTNTTCATIRIRKNFNLSNDTTLSTRYYYHSLVQRQSSFISLHVRNTKMKVIHPSTLMTSFLLANVPLHRSGTSFTLALPFGTRGGGVGSEEIDLKEDGIAFVPTGTTEGGTSLDTTMTTAGITNEAIVDPRFGDIQMFKPHDNPAIDSKRLNNVVQNFYASSSSSTTNDSDNTASSDQLINEIKSIVSNMTDFLQSTRRVLHKHPELMFQEQFTSQTVQAVLQHLNVSYTTGWAINTKQYAIPGPGGYGVVADIGTGTAPCVLLRADMDALPILERTNGIDSFKSINDNKMHACGHDAHTTMLLGAVAVLKQIESSLPGTVRILFQPAEEGGAGAKRMIEEGLLDKYPQPQYAFGMHVWPSLPSGTVASRPGPIMAACERFEILIAGVGGHAAMPHLTIDPVVAASAIIMNLQTIVSRTISPLEAGVCSITQINTGPGAFNVIPHSATLKGTIRSLSTEGLLQLRDSVQHIVDMTAAVHKCNATITYSPDYYPVTVNDPTLYETFSKQVGSMVATDGIIQEVEPTMGAEDFSFLAQRIPSTFFWLGQGSGTNPPTNYGLHHPHFALDESVLPTGVQLHVNLAIRSIAKLLQQQQQQQNTIKQQQ